MRKKIIFEGDNLKEIIRLYTEEKMGTPSISKLFKIDKSVINRTLKENGVKLDTPGRRNLGGRSEAQKRYESKPDVKNKRKKYYSKWSKENRDKLRDYHAQWREKNREHVNEYGKNYERKRRAEDPKYRLGVRTRTAVYTCLKEKDIAKYKSTFDILGYTLDDLMNHLEGLFIDGMTWDNYGEWHVDHKIPMSSFNFTSVDDEEFKLCWSLNNLQPLWAIDNLRKGTSLIF